MRDYSKVSSSFWTGDTGRQLRGDSQAQVVALYLMTSPHANMIGVFHCPMIYIAHDTGSSLQGASKALLRLIEGGFCRYDEDAELVWVVEMAKFQVGESLKLADNRVKDVQKQFCAIGNSLIKQEFFDKYGENYHLTNEAPCKPLASPLQAPLKPGTGTGTEEKSISCKPAVRTHPGFAEFWNAYPKKEGKVTALAEWKKQKPDLEIVLSSIKQQSAGKKWRDGYILLPTRWLREQRWNDEVQPALTVVQAISVNDPFRGAI